MRLGKAGVEYHSDGSSSGSGSGSGFGFSPQLEYITSAAGSSPSSFLSGSDVVIVDPPRKGLEPQLLQALMDLDPAPGWNHAGSRSPAGVGPGPTGTHAPQQADPNPDPDPGQAHAGHTLDPDPRPAAAAVGALGPHTQGPGPEPAATTATGPHTLLYLSCGYEALERECAALLGSRAGWRLEAATAFLFFPGTDSIETLAVFRRPAA